MRNVNSRLLRKAVSPSLILGLSLVACGGSEPKTSPGPSTPNMGTELQPPRPDPPFPGLPPTTERITLTFNSHGNPPYVRVYPGVLPTDRDRTPNGQYNDGETVGIVCKSMGRLVTSPETGDSSTVWFKIGAATTQFASAAYADPVSNFASIRPCESPDFQP